MFITLYAIVLFVLAAMLIPWDMEKNIDIKEYFFKQRLWFFGTLFVAWCLDIPETVVKSAAGVFLVYQLAVDNDRNRLTYAQPYSAYGAATTLVYNHRFLRVAFDSWKNRHLIIRCQRVQTPNK